MRGHQVVVEEKPHTQVLCNYPLKYILPNRFEVFTFVFMAGDELKSGRLDIMENKKYERLTKSLVYPLIEKYYSSGDLPSVFYKREGLSESQFYTWRQHYLRDHPSVAKKLGIVPKPARRANCRQQSKTSSGASSSASVGFVRVESDQGSSVSPDSAADYELCYPNGVRLRVASTIPSDRLSALIKLY